MSEAAPSSNGGRFRVLSLDGGGARGYLAAGFLARVEQYLDGATKQALPLGRRFDLICGTSTGGIIALGLAAGISAREIWSLYENLIPKVFDRSQRRSWPAWLFRPRYRGDVLRQQLDAFFGDKTLQRDHLVSDVCVTGVALTTGNPRLYKSDYLARNAAHLSERLADIALGASAAPIFFEAQSIAHSEWMIDGGVCCNNPAIVAFVDALQFERKSLRGTSPPKNFNSIVLLSVGTGEQASLPFDAEDVANAGLAKWARNFPEIALASQSELVHSQAAFLLGNNYFRFNPALKTRMRLDDASKVRQLKNLMDIDRSCEDFLRAHLV